MHQLNRFILPLVSETGRRKITKYLIMKTYVPALLALSLSASLHAGDLKDVKSEIKHVTVYRQGAQVERSLNVSLPKGKSDIYITGLSSKIDERTLQMTAGNQVMIVSVNFSIDYLNQQNVSKEVEQLSAKHKQIADSIEMTGKLDQVYQQEKEMILANKSIGGNNGVSVSELKQTASFFRERMSEIEMTLYGDKLKVERMTLRANAIARQLQTLNAQLNQPTGTVKATVSAEQPVTAGMSLTYIIKDARWIPVYDIRIRDVDSPLNLFYKAQVSQNTDEDWTNVKLTLSTGNPSLNNTRPDLQTYFLTFNNYYAPAPAVEETVNRNMLSGRVIAESGEPLAGASVIIKGTDTGTVTDRDGKYNLKLPVNAQMVSYSYLGYTTKDLPISANVINVTLVESAVMMDEVVVIGYGSDSESRLTGRVSGMNTKTLKQTTEYVPLAIQQQQVSTEFKIEIPYTIPSDNKPYDVTMIEYQIPANYQYSSVPKLSSDVFLMAQIPDWTDYNLQNGEANLFFQGVYQGKTYIDVRAMEDTLKLSIGKDKDIVVERKIKKNYQSKRTIGASVREQKTWEITVKNNKNIPVRITLEDQYPVSKDSEIKVEDLQYSGAKVNADKGQLVWDLQMNPKGIEQLNVSYTVRYPKNRKVLVD